jgi:tetratricopeptide (TPR) repeat protein
MLNKKAEGIRSIALLFGIIFGIFTHGEIKASDQANATMLAMEGSNLSSKEAEALEEKVKVNPNDLPSRTQLLGYYFLRAQKLSSARKARQPHVMWIIRNSPDSEIAGLPFAQLDPILDGELYYEAEKLWLRQVETHKKNAAILGNAANFVLIYNREAAEKLLKMAQAIEPNNPKWSRRLGFLYSMKMRHKSTESRREPAAKSLEQLESSRSDMNDDTGEWSILSDLAEAAFAAGDLSKARAYATELLDKAAQHTDDWNYGNAVHHSNLILGRLALKSGKLEKAKEYLIEAGKTPGSPQLNSFGPNMTLAKELLEKGEREVVIKYFQLCAQFWEMGRNRLQQWTYTVSGGGIPDFGGNLDY